MQTGPSIGATEAINRLLAKRIAPGFRKFRYLRFAFYRKAGELNPQASHLPST